MEELKASLLAHGLMQNLVVTDTGDGTYRVIAGGRRLEAIHSLQAEGKLPEDFAVPCQIVTEEHALEMSLAENTVRLAMHPADQFEAFAALIDQGESAAEVAERFGVEESLVLKRMKLARVAPELLAEYRSEGMTLECLMAFTVTDDHRRQLKVFKSLQDWQKDDPTAIRAALTEKMVEASDKLARFVGLDAYRRCWRFHPRRPVRQRGLSRKARPAAPAGRGEARRHPQGTGSRRLGLDRDQPRAGLGRHQPLRPDQAAADRSPGRFARSQVPTGRRA